MATPFSSVPAKALVFAGIAALAACGGGTSAGTPGAGPNLQSDARADQSIKHEVVPNPYPTTIGEQWKYNYTLVLANSPGTVQDTTGTIATTLQSQTTFNGNPVFDYHSVFNYSSGADGGITGTTTTDNYEYFVGSYYYYYGNSITGSESSPKYSNTSTDAQTYPTPFILDILPESNGNHATEPGAYTLTATSTSTANGGTDVSESYSRANSGASTTAETITLAGKKFLVHHIVYPRALEENLAARIGREKPDAVVFGHTHKPFCETINGILFFNPGYAGKPKFGAERSVAILHLEGKAIRHEFIPL